MLLTFSATPAAVISRVPSIPGWGCRRHLPTPFALHRPPLLRRKLKSLVCSAVKSAEANDTESDFTVLTAINSLYNNIVIIDAAESRMLLLDSTRMPPDRCYLANALPSPIDDEFASLPAIIPKGPIAIFGLGGGTAAHLMLSLWPSLQLEGWEIDEILIDKAREHLGLSELEKYTEDGGILHVHVGDALSASSTISGGYAGIVVDLFSGGEVLPQLQEVQTWLELNEKLMPNGRFMVNCGGGNAAAAASATISLSIDLKHSLIDDSWEKNPTLNTLCKAFPGQINWMKMPKSEGENYLALTGPLPDTTTWAAALPGRLSSSVKQWTSCLPS